MNQIDKILPSKEEVDELLNKPKFPPMRYFRDNVLINGKCIYCEHYKPTKILWIKIHKKSSYRDNGCKSWKFMEPKNENL